MSGTNDLSWLLDGLVKQVVGVRHAVLLSADGLCMAKSEEFPQDQAEQLSAMATSLQSVARQTGQTFSGGAVRQTLVEMEHAFLFLCEAGYGARLAVLADATSDVELVGHQMTLLVGSVGDHLSTPPRSDSVEQPTLRHA